MVQKNNLLQCYIQAAFNNKDETSLSFLSKYFADISLLSGPEDFRIIKTQPKSKQLVLKWLQVVRRIKAQKNQVGQLCEVKGVDLKSNLAIKSAGGLSSAEEKFTRCEEPGFYHQGSHQILPCGSCAWEGYTPSFCWRGTGSSPSCSKIARKKRIYCASNPFPTKARKSSFTCFITFIN